MKLKLLFILTLSYTFAIGQISGIVKDSISNKVIPYVNIWVEGEEIGTSSDEAGQFFLARWTPQKC